MRLPLVLALAVLSSASVAASASVISYTSQSAFDAATSGLTTYSFPDLGYSSLVSNPYTSGPLTFSDSGGILFVDNDGFYGSGQTYLDDVEDTTEQITLGGATALAFNIGTFYDAGTLTFDVGGDTFTFTTPAAQSPIFVGFTSDSPITSLSITDTTRETDILNYQVGSAGTVSATPEPSSIALLGTGLLGFAGLVRRRLA